MKISEKIVNFANDYISMGKTIMEKQSYLNSACTAWNISCLPTHMRKKAIKKYIKRYKKLNSYVNDENNLIHDLNILINKKENLYQNDQRYISSAKIVQKGNVFSILAIAINKTKEKYQNE